MSRFVVVVFLLFTSLAVGVNSVSAVDGDPLTVTYDSGGGSSVADTASTVGGTVADPGVPSRLGYRFDGWSLGATPTAISAGVSHSCALLAGGTVTCWGNNDYSQVSGAAGVTSATAVSAGLNHSCALLADKTVTCWGGNAFGRVSGAAGVTNAIAISSGGYHSCALLAGGTVTCWGVDWDGQVWEAAGVANATAISSGNSHSCALIAGGTVTCWGQVSSGQATVPVGITTAIAISSGGYHSCVLIAGGTVTCWGDDGYGQSSVPAGVTTATAISAGLYHSCALLADGTVTCWGADGDLQVSVPVGITTATAISAGGTYSCALIAGGTVSCWGDDGSGQSTAPASLTTAISSWPYTHGQTSDFTMYARWSANTLAVTFDSGGGSSVASSFTSTGGIVTPIVRPTRAGYTWAGWYSAATGGTPVYLARPHGRTSDFTLYARWTANRLIVTYDTGGGSGISSSTARTGGEAWYPGRPTRAGYTFVGWYTAASGGVRVTFRYTHGRTSDFTLYARWTANLV